MGVDPAGCPWLLCLALPEGGAASQELLEICLQRAAGQAPQRRGHEGDGGTALRARADTGSASPWPQPRCVRSNSQSTWCCRIVYSLTHSLTDKACLRACRRAALWTSRVRTPNRTRVCDAYLYLLIARVSSEWTWRRALCATADYQPGIARVNSKVPLLRAVSSSAPAYTLHAHRPLCVPRCPALHGAKRVAQAACHDSSHDQRPVVPQGALPYLAKLAPCT